MPYISGQREYFTAIHPCINYTFIQLTAYPTLDIHAISKRDIHNNLLASNAGLADECVFCNCREMIEL